MEERQNRFIIPEEEKEQNEENNTLANANEKEFITTQTINPLDDNKMQTQEEKPLVSIEEIPRENSTLNYPNSLEKDKNGTNILDLRDLEEQVEPTPPLEEIVEEANLSSFERANNLQKEINKILHIDHLEPVKIKLQEKVKEEKKEEVIEPPKILPVEDFSREERLAVFKSDLLERLEDQAKHSGKFSILSRYGEDFCSKDYVTNPAIGREEEIKQLILTLLTPEKSAILVGKPGIGKTSIVEGLAYRLELGEVPDLLKEYSIISIKTPSLLGTLPNGETRLQTLVDEVKLLDKVILFIDEIHMLIGATVDSAMDFANMFKESLGRGQIKIIGATTTEEYERYILRDKAFVRRFQQIEVVEPTREHTIKILMGTLPKIEKETGAKMKYTMFQQSEIMAFITDITSEYKRIYGIGSRYPDICLTLLKQAFSQAMFENRKEVNILDIRKSIENSTNIYPDVIRKELPNFDAKFEKMIKEETGNI